MTGPLRALSARELSRSTHGRSVVAISEAVRERGGRALLVGGVVRDALLGLPALDFDLEVFGLGRDELETVLRTFGEVITVGRAFGVLRIKGTDIDVSLPRRDSKSGPGHRGFAVAVDPELSFAEASRRRDLTINAMGADPLNGELLDPHNGRKDLANEVLRATDLEHFSEDPLRGLRVAQFAARLEMAPDAELIDLCTRLDLSELPGERCFAEFRKLLLKGRRPSLGLEFLRTANLLRFFPELDALVGVPQDAEWHPEGDVWVHNMMVVDAAAQLRRGDGDDEALMFGALCHDFGKPATTEFQDGRIRSRSHDRAGVPPSEAFLERLRAPRVLIVRVGALVQHHLAPALFDKNGATERAYRRLARKLDDAGVTMELLGRVARADHLGRTTPDALAGLAEPIDAFVRRATELAIERESAPDVVMGRHLIARGLEPGARFGEILSACRDVQDETGAEDPDEILRCVLGARSE